MNEQTDSQLLRHYAESHSEAAFSELVRRHLDFVYSAALRMVSDPHLAEDVTQSVFTALAKSASQLSERLVISSWLHRTAQNIAAQRVRTIERRRAREQEAAAMNHLLATEPDAPWEHIAPHLDAALGELPEPDRDAVMLRYFERKSARQMAFTLGISEDAAQKRVSRAVERLREFFAKRGVTVGASRLAIVLSANAVQAAPVGLAVTISTAAALGGTTIASAATATATKAIAMTTLQETIIGAVLAAAVGTGVYQARQAAKAREQNQLLQQQQVRLTDEQSQLKAENERLSNLVARATTLQVVTNVTPREVLRLRGEVGRLRRELSDTTAAKNNADVPSEDQINFKELRDSFKRGASAKVSDLNGALKLDYEQQKSLMNVLSNRVELQIQLYSAMKSGDISASEMRKQLAKLFADEERNIVAMLDTDQQAAYEQMKKEEFARRAKMGAEYEAASMKRLLKLSQEQADAVASVLANVQYPAGSFKSDNEGVLPPDAAEAKQQFETLMVPALQTVLSAEQLQTSRQTRLKEIEEIAQYLEKYYGPSGR